jgi:hypothetical protein
MSNMQYNVCECCGAKDGRAGVLIDGLCRNCHDTRKTGNVSVHMDLLRSEDELAKTFSLAVAPSN